jgi:lysophospholipase L1-like esterase
MPRDTYLDTEVIFNNHGQISNTRKKFAESKPINEFIRRQMETNIEKMIDITRMNNATPILMTYHIKGINNTIKAVAKNKQVYLIDNEAEFLKLENRSDYIFKMSPEHPNAKGYEVIAQNIIDHLIMWNIVRKPFPNAR